MSSVRDQPGNSQLRADRSIFGPSYWGITSGRQGRTVTKGQSRISIALAKKGGKTPGWVGILVGRGGSPPLWLRYICGNRHSFASSALSCTHGKRRVATRIDEYEVWRTGFDWGSAHRNLESINRGQ